MIDDNLRVKIRDRISKKIFWRFFKNEALEKYWADEN